MWPTTLGLHILLLVACGAPPMSAVPTPAERGGRPAVSAPITPALDAGADAAPPHCYNTANRASVLPSFTIPATQRACDLKDRIILVGEKSVTVVMRPQLQRVQAPIARSEHLGDRCDSTSGGHAGCSIKFDRYWSKALGDGSLEFGTNEGNVLHDERSPAHDQFCRDGSGPTVIATCSTAKRFLTVRYVEPAGRDPSCWHVGGSLWEEGRDQASELAGDVDRSSSVGDHWVFYFLARSDSESAITLTFERRTPTAVLEIAGEREPCIAFSLSR